jgi:hypothetical protein
VSAGRVFCRLFAPITGIERLPGRVLLITAAAQLDDEAPADGVAGAGARLYERAADHGAGSVENAAIERGRLCLTARIEGAKAVIKVAAGVYCGLAIILHNGRIDHAALVDAPGAIDSVKTSASLTLHQDIRKMNFNVQPRHGGSAVRRAVADLSGPDGPLLNKTETRRLVIEEIDRRQHAERMACGNSGARTISRGPRTGTMRWRRSRRPAPRRWRHRRGRREAETWPRPKSISSPSSARQGRRPR